VYNETFLTAKLIIIKMGKKALTNVFTDFSNFIKYQALML